jgi:ATP-dependent Clp protease protease subunit
VHEALDPEADIDMYIMSPGGVVTGGLAIHDVMKLISCDVRTIGMGHCESMGAFLLAAGTKGKRCVMPNWRGMIHQPSGGGHHGQITDQEIHVEEGKRLKKRLTELLAENCGRTFEETLAACERDNFMGPDEAKEFGLVDEVLEIPAKKSAK